MLQPTSPSTVVKTAAAASAGRLLKPCPPSNKDFACDSIHSVEGEYTLLHDIHFDTIAPQFDSGTRASVVDVCPRAASSSTSSLEMSSASSKHQEDHVSWHKPTLTLEISRAQPIPIQGSHHHHPHQHHPHASSTQMLTPPRNTPTANHNNNNGANAALMPIMHPSSPTPTSSTPLSPPPMDHASSNGNNTTSSSPPPPPMPTMAPSVSSATATTLDASQHDFSSSFSSLFSWRNSVRFHNTPQRKPRNNLTKTKSSFVLKIVIHDRLASILANRTIDNGFLFFNVGTSFLWMDARGKPKDPLSRIVFSKAFPTCHDVNTVTKTNEHLDVIIGFSSGDIVWYDPLTSKYFRLNKDGIMKKEAVTAIKWIPGSEDLFMAAFADGTMMIMDKDREDQAFTPAIRTTWIEQQFHVTRPHKNAKYNPVSHWSVNDQGVSGFAFSPDGVYLAIVGLDGTLRIVNYMQERLLDVFASYYGNFLCVAWSPDGRYILTGGQDDLVTIWGMTEKRIVARCQGHKSWVTGVAFDPFRYDEGSLYRFGSVGEDCKLMLWDFSYSALHRPKHKHRHHPGSPRNSRSPKESHRFSFVGTDAIKYRPPTLTPQLFDRLPPMDKMDQMHMSSMASLQQDSPPLLSPLPAPSPPPPTSPSPPQPRHSFGFRKRSSNANNPAQHSFFQKPTSPVLRHETTHHVAMPTLHPAQSKKQVPLLQPTTMRAVHADPCTDIIFKHHAIVTTDRRGRIRTWGRP